MKEASVYAAIRQGKAKTGMAEELARQIKEGAIPIISDVEGFMAYYVVTRRHRDSDQHLQQLCGSRGVKQARARVDRPEPDAPACRASHSDGRASDRAHLGIVSPRPFDRCCERLSTGSKDERDKSSCSGSIRAHFFQPR
jgi:hypothetical protein